MALNRTDWREIQNYIERRVASVGEYFSQGKVIKVDEANKLVWLKEFGDVAIPIISFNYQVKYYVLDGSGHTVPKTTKANSPEVTVLTPRVGDIVLVARLLGSRSNPSCLGIVQSRTITGGDN